MRLPSRVGQGRLLAICLALPVAIPVQAQPPGAPEDDAADDFIELLEFLGEFSDDEGELIDPLRFEEQAEASGNGEAPEQRVDDEAAVGAEDARAA